MSNKSKKKIHDTNFNFATTKGSMNACMELVGFSTSNKVRNHCSRAFRTAVDWVFMMPRGVGLSDGCMIIVEIPDGQQINNSVVGTARCLLVH